MYNNCPNIQPRYGSIAEDEVSEVKIDIDGGNYRDKPRPPNMQQSHTMPNSATTGESTGIFAVLSANWMWILGVLIVGVIILLGLIYLLKGPDQIVTPTDKILDKSADSATASKSENTADTELSVDKKPNKKSPADLLKERDELRKAQAELTSAPRAKTDDEISSIME